MVKSKVILILLLILECSSFKTYSQNNEIQWLSKEEAKSLGLEFEEKPDSIVGEIPATDNLIYPLYPTFGRECIVYDYHLDITFWSIGSGLPRWFIFVTKQLSENQYKDIAKGVASLRPSFAAKKKGQDQWILSQGVEKVDIQETFCIDLNKEETIQWFLSQDLDGTIWAMNFKVAFDKSRNVLSFFSNDVPIGQLSLDVLNIR